MSISAVKHLLSSPVAYHPILARALGSVPAAVMLSQGIYWQNKSEQEGGTTFFLTAEEWFNQTGVTEDAQKTARKVLGKAGFWHEKLMGMPARMHYRIDVDALVAVIDQYLKTATPVAVDYRNKKREKPRTSSGKFRQQVAVNYGNKETIENKERLIRESARAENETESFNLEEEKNTPTPIPPAPSPAAPSWRDRPRTDTPAQMSDDLRRFYTAYPEDWKKMLAESGAKYPAAELRGIITAFCAYQIENNRTANNYQQTHAALQRWLISEKNMRKTPANNQRAAAAATYEPPRRILN